MADVKISELNGATTPLSGTEVVPLVQNGETKKVAVSEIGGGANPTSGFLPVNDNGVFVDSVVSENSNKIGIGTTSPSTALDVVGAIALNDGNNNTKVGTNAGQNNTGGDQSAFGFFAGRNNTGGSQSAFGRGAGVSNTGTNQSVFGYQAGFSNTGDDQSAFGREAGRSNTGGSQSAFGRDAGRYNTGNNQSAFGFFTGRDNSGNDQSAFGYEAGRQNTGTIQSAFGRSAGQNNTGDGQSVFGYAAGQFNTGTNQSAFGRDAGRSNTGDDNSNFGYEAGYRLSDGTTVNTGSSDSVFLGSSTKALGASQTNQIVIGHNATGIGANSVTLGNDSIATTALKGNVGIGTTSPSTALHVVGAITVNDGGKSVFIGDNAGLNDDRSSNQNVGIGINALRNNTAGSNNTATGLNSLFNNTTGVNNIANGLYSLFNNTTGANNIANGSFSGRFISDGTTANSITNNSVYLGFNTKALANNQTNQIVIGHDATGIGSNSVVLGNDSIAKTALKGNVGIGTTSPSEKLDVGGIVKAEGYKSFDGSAGITQNVNTGGGNTLVIKNGIITQVI